MSAKMDFAQDTAKYLSAACPTSVVATNELFESHAQEEDIVKALQREESLGRYIRSRGDFAEGVRAVLVDKTKDAAFNPEETAAVDLDAIHAADRKSTRLNSTHVAISYAVFCATKKKTTLRMRTT